MTVRTLLVDDNKTFLAAVRNFLTMVPDVEIVGEAHDGWSAVELAKSLNPDLVLLDIVMPEMNGLEVAQALKDASHPSRIVFLSMHDSDSYRTAARELGAFAYVGKGDFVADLIPIIDRLVDAVATQDVKQGVAPGEWP
jgi:DNA-binding NarL/FixJ family response regulator